MKYLYSPHYSANILSIYENGTRDSFCYIALSKEEADIVESNCRFFFPLFDVFNLYSDFISLSKEYVSKKIKSLIKLKSSKVIIIFDINNFFTNTIPIKLINDSFFEVKDTLNIDIENLKNILVAFGYKKQIVSQEIGDFSIRGNVIDIVCDKFGYRIDLFDNTIKTFDLISQMSDKEVDNIIVTACTEVILSKNNIDLFLKNKNNTASAIEYEDLFLMDSDDLCEMIENFYENSCKVFEYFSDVDVFFDYFIIDKFHDYLKIKNRFCFTKSDNVHYFKIKNSFASYVMHSPSSIMQSLKKIMCCYSIDFSISDLSHNNEKFFYKTILFVNSNYAANLILKNMTLSNIDALILEKWEDINNVNVNCLIAVCKVNVNFFFKNILIIFENDIFGNTYGVINVNKNKSYDFLKQINKISEGDIVIHKKYGIARFLGINSIEFDGILNDFLVLEYQNNRKLHITVESIESIKKYGSCSESVVLDKLGGVGWQTRKKRVAKIIEDIADNLLKFAAMRKLKKSDIFTPCCDYDKFCAAFKFSETEDQIAAIRDVEKDLSSGIPMDRLICGDAGFGKTEVAVRAAFIVASSGLFQVVVLVPTKILCEQHFKTFQERFSDTGLVVKSMNGLKTRKENLQVMEMIKNGTVNVVIGTHNLFNKTIKFFNIGLFIVDEEHRFGVKQKEYIKDMYPSVHFLSMSATPIPRTLQMSIVGIRDISILSVPPKGRVEVLIYVKKISNAVIVEAISRELGRNGAVFYVCPYIKNIAKIIESIDSAKKDIPFEIRADILHGGMSANEIENKIYNFCNGITNLLISTPVIEVGVDMPIANTMIVHDADCFGLSQLYQLKGRVGRSDKEGYVYFTVDENKLNNKEKMYRLSIMNSMSKLNLGFSVASYDMENRGFGNLVGSEQSGHVKEIGVEIYNDMLAAAIEKIKNNKQCDISDEVEKSVEIKINISIKIPSDYISDDAIKLNFYQRFANAKTLQSLDEVIKEIKDRFGIFPHEVENLINITKIRILSLINNVNKVVSDLNGMSYISFREYKNSNLLIDFIKSNKQFIGFFSNDTLFINHGSSKIHLNVLTIIDVMLKIVNLYTE